MFQSYYCKEMTVLPTSILSTENSIRTKLSPVLSSWRISVFALSVLRNTHNTVHEEWLGLTYVEVAASERLQDAVHSPHVEQEAKLRDAHGHQAEQEGGGGDGFEERLGCREKVKGNQTSGGLTLLPS